jgi:group II intron reverse transcriptase/maturase
MEPLLQKALCMENLRSAWETVAANDGLPGVDSLSIRRWRRNWEERLVDLAGRLHSHTYQPHPLRLRRIPKPGRREWRLLRIPTVTDRVLQRAVLQVLYPVFEPRFLRCSFGYRPHRGLKQALERILVLRENDYRQVLDADIDAFFDNVDHDLLLGFLRHDLPDDSLLPLITGWLECSRLDPQRAVGIPLGSPLSPLWANVLLHRLDLAVTQAGWEMVRYADDFIVLAENKRSLLAAYKEVGKILSSLRLCCEPHKTRLTSFEQGFDFIGVHFKDDEYSYIYMDKEVKVSGDKVDLLFSDYGPEY